MLLVMNPIASSIRFATALTAFAALTSACAVESSPTPQPPLDRGPSFAHDTSDVATRFLEIDASAQTYGGDLAVYARLYYDLGTLKLGAGDTLVATIAGETRPLTRNQAGDYVGTFPARDSAVDVEIHFDRPADKTSTTLVIRVPGAFRLVSPPSTLHADAPIVFNVDPPIPEGAHATVRFEGGCFAKPLGEPVVLSARGAADGTVTLAPSAFDFYRSKTVDLRCETLVGVRYETYVEPSIGFARSSALGLEERGYHASVVLPKGE